ncbi:MAG: oxygen-independent coproporphyrinogen III oxidase-like protein [Comamonas sp.]|nr:oxygen-independent coproporphyrinogen III oxidase-like protein [Comamonas sp.]
MIPIIPASATPALNHPLGQAPADVQHYMRPGTLQLSTLPPLSLYVHLPWCIKKCPYCDFNSHAWDKSNNLHLPEQQYIQALFSDLEASLPLIWGRPVYSIFIGGGTPSLFSPEAIADLISGLRARLPLEAACEITLEANPGTFETQRFAAFAQAGVTRLSIGVQSFDDRFLQALGRVHSAEQARAAITEAAKAFSTFNLDMMYALPGQSLYDLKNDIAQALAFSPPHLSVYHLSIEPNTYFAKYPPNNLPEDDSAYAMLDAITEACSLAGLARYEVSAYAQADQECLHNLNYWQFGDYLGIGAGAHSKLSFAHRIIRQVRLQEPQRYMKAALEGRPLASDRSVHRQDLPFEFMLNALRLRKGTYLQNFIERTGLPPSSISAPLERAVALGLLQRHGDKIQPSERGFDFLNDLQSLFLAD